MAPLQEMDEEGFQAFVEGISTKSWSRILKIIDAIDERETPPVDKSKKIIKLLHSKGLCVVAESLTEQITDATTFEGAKTTILYHWAQTKNSEQRNLCHHFQTAKAIYYAKETFCKSDDQNASFSEFILENCGLSSRSVYPHSAIAEREILNTHSKESLATIF
jgi:hypothetical protein